MLQPETNQPETLLQNAVQHPRPHGGLVDGPKLAKVEDLHPVNAAHARMQVRSTEYGVTGS